MVGKGGAWMVSKVSMSLLFLLVTMAGQSLAVETLQSHLDYSTTERPGERTTSPAWPKLSLNTFTGSPTDPWTFSPHTRADTGAETTTRQSVQVVTPVTTISAGTEEYQRHMLPHRQPYLSDKKHWQHSFTKAPARGRLRRLGAVREEVEVFIPKIFVDMAFTGHYSTISVPRNRVHQTAGAQPGDVKVVLPRGVLQSRAQPRSDAAQPSLHSSVNIPKRLIVEGVQKAEERLNSSYFWPLRLLEGARERMSSWASGMFNLFSRRSNSLNTLYRPHKNQLASPYQSSSSSRRVNRVQNRKQEYFGSNNWRPVTNPDLVRTDRKSVSSQDSVRKSVSSPDSVRKSVSSPDSVRTDRKDKAINDSNYWKLLPNFVTSSGSKLKTYFWRHFPGILNRSSNVELGYWVPGKPGPVVWGDLEGRLETVQSQYVKQNPTKLNVTSREP